MKRMGNMDPNKMNTSNPLAAMQGAPIKQKKGKGKGKKRFRY